MSVRLFSPTGNISNFKLGERIRRRIIVWLMRVGSTNPSREPLMFISVLGSETERKLKPCIPQAMPRSTPSISSTTKPAIKKVNSSS